MCPYSNQTQCNSRSVKGSELKFVQSLKSCARSLYGTTFTKLNESGYLSDPMVEAHRKFYSQSAWKGDPFDIWTFEIRLIQGHSGLPTGLLSSPSDPFYPFFYEAGELFIEGIPQRLTSAFNLVGTVKCSWLKESKPKE